MSKFNQFGAFSTIIKGKELSEQDKNKINSYLMLRWLSGNQGIIRGANQVNRYYNIPVNLQYDMFRNILHGKVNFIKYPKGTSEKKSKDIELIQKHYKVNAELANSMMELISQDELNTLNEIYGS